MVHFVWSEELVVASVHGIQWLRGVDSVGGFEVDASGVSDGGQSDLVSSLLVSVEAHLHAVFDESHGVLLAHVGAPSVSEEDTAIVTSKSSHNVVLLKLESMKVGLSKEHIFCLWVDSSDDGRD